LGIVPERDDGDREKRKKREREGVKMKKVLAALMILALVAPAFAVTFSGADLGGGKLQISYNVPAGEVLRGVALKLSNTNGATIADTAAVSNINSFFDVFIDYAFSVPGGFTVTPRVGHPVANPAAAGELTLFPASVFSLSMGVLDETGAQGGVTGAGVLCDVQFTLAGNATITVEADTLRGGAVVGDAVTQPSTINVPLNAVVNYTLAMSAGAGGVLDADNSGVYAQGTVVDIQATPNAGFTFAGWTPITDIANAAAEHTTITMNADATIVANFAAIPEAITQPSVAKTTAAPAIAGRVNGGRVETFVASGAVDNLGHAMEYQFTWGDATVSAWGAATQTKTYTYVAAATYNVTVQARCIAHPTVLSVASAALALTTEEVKSSATAIYAGWAQFGRPKCWAYPRNCRGDANGAKSGYTPSTYIWVNSADLTIFQSAYNKYDSVLAGVPNGICADNNRARSGYTAATYIWVNSADLTIFQSYYNKYESITTVCAQTNYHYWTAP
jgi:hypothetical protein